MIGLGDHRVDLFQYLASLSTVRYISAILSPRAVIELGLLWSNNGCAAYKEDRKS
jgi:hypothetical protein